MGIGNIYLPTSLADESVLVTNGIEAEIVNTTSRK